MNSIPEINEVSLNKRVLAMLLLIISIIVLIVTTRLNLKQTSHVSNTHLRTATSRPSTYSYGDDTNYYGYSAQYIMNTLVTSTECKATQDTTVHITYEEAQMLMRIAQAEAEIDGVEGMAAIMMVVLNRVNDPRFPSTVEGVIFASGQFSPIMDGRYDSIEISYEAHLALAEIEKGTYSYLNEALFFENATDSWQSTNCTYLYTIGHHRFYK